MAGNVWIKVHGYLSVFFLPVALLYAVTGALYIVEIEGGSRREVITFQPAAALPEDMGALQALVTEQLEAHGMPRPKGQPRVFRGNFVWGRPSSYNVTLQAPGKTPEAQIHIVRPGLYRQLVMLHKAVCGWGFKILGIAFGAAMVFIYVSGILIIWKIMSARKALLTCFFAGLIVLVLTAMLSL